MNIDALPFDGLRALGHDLEPLVGRSVRGTSIAQLREVVGDAISEARQIDADGLSVILKRHAPTESDEAPERDAKAEEVKSGTPASRAAAEAVSVAADAGDGVVCFQVLAHMSRDLIRRGDIIINPSPEIQDKVLMRVPHKKLTLTEALMMGAMDNWRINRRHSRLEGIK